MANETKLTLRQTHRLVMTPMLQQAIKLLPLARFELITLINQEMTENPFLEEEPIQPSDTDSENNGSGEYSDIEYAKEEKGENQNPVEIDWDTFFERYLLHTSQTLRRKHQRFGSLSGWIRLQTEETEVQLLPFRNRILDPELWRVRRRFAKEGVA